MKRIKKGYDHHISVGEECADEDEDEERQQQQQQRPADWWWFGQVDVYWDPATSRQKIHKKWIKINYWTANTYAHDDASQPASTSRLHSIQLELMPICRYWNSFPFFIRKMNQSLFSSVLLCPFLFWTYSESVSVSIRNINVCGVRQTT